MSRQISDGDFLEGSCNSEYPVWYEDSITPEWAVDEGIIEEWNYGPMYHCCKEDAAVRPSLVPPYFPEEKLSNMIYII